jgi:hypothetical protein
MAAVERAKRSHSDRPPSKGRLRWHTDAIAPFEAKKNGKAPLDLVAKVLFE